MTTMDECKSSSVIVQVHSEPGIRKVTYQPITENSTYASCIMVQRIMATPSATPYKRILWTYTLRLRSGHPSYKYALNSQR